MTNKGNPSKNWKRLLLFSLLAPWMLSCGALSTPIVTPTVTPTATPTLIPIPTPALPGILDTLKPVLQGHGVPEAGAYDPNSPIPLHIVIVDPTGQGHKYNDHLCFPPKWQPASLADTELVVVLGPEQDVELDTAWYEGGRPYTRFQITRYRYERTIEIRDARSGSLLWAHTLRGSEPAPFEYLAPVNQRYIEGSHVGFLPVLLYLTGTLCKLPEQCPSAAVFLQPPPLNSDLMALSPNRQILAVSDSIGETVDEYYTARSVVHLYQVTNGEVLHDLRHENLTLSRLEFSPDGRFLATHSVHRKIWLWQVADGQLLYTLESHRFIAFSPDAQMLATENGDGIELWQVADWKLLRNLPQRGVLSIGFSPDNQYLISIAPKDLKLWRLSDGKLLLHFEPSGWDRLDALTFSPDGEILAGFTGREVRLWQTMNGSLLRTFDLGTGYSEASRLQFSPNGQFLAIYLRGDSTNRGKVQLWRVSDTQLLSELYGDRGIFSSDSQFIAVFDGSYVEILRVADGTLLRSLVGDIAFIIDDRLALFTDNERWMLCPIELWSRAVTR